MHLFTNRRQGLTDVKIRAVLEPDSEGKCEFHVSQNVLFNYDKVALGAPCNVCKVSPEPEVRTSEVAAPGQYQ